MNDMATAAQPLDKSNSPTYGEIIKKFQKTAPVDVVGIAEAMGINVWEDELPNGYSGKLFVDELNGGTSKFSIVVAKHESRARQRFTIAHEIAHFILHRDDLDGGILENALFRGGLSNKKEVEANKLAADILMPLHLIKSLMAEGNVTVAALAEKLEVSESAVAIRLEVPFID
jgi:Zn-dependent peptidase ImmA (M78 family)